MTSLSFPEGITQIGDGAFQRCGRLETLFFPSTMKSIDWGVFCESHENEYGGGECTCDSIRRIEIKGIATWFNSNRFTERNHHVAAPYADLYVNGDLLTDIVLPDTMARIRPALFYGCKKLHSVVFPNNLKVIDDCAFENCTGIENLELPQGLDSIKSSAFSRCKGVKYVNLPQELKYIGMMAFGSCTELISVSFPNKLENIAYGAFESCKSLQSVVLPEGLKSIESCAFQNCISLTSVKLPSTLRFIDDCAFNQCNVGFEFASIVPPTIEGMNPLGDEDNLLYVPEEGIEAYRTAWSDKVNDILCLERQHDWDVTVEAEEKSSAVLQAVGGVSDNEAARNVVRLKVSGTVNSYDFMVMRNKMTSLRELDLTDAHVVYNPYEHYQDCHSWNDSLPDYAFYRKELRVCKLPKSVTYIGQYAFSECRKLTNMDIPEKVQEIGGYAFYGCNQLKEVGFQEGLERIGSDAFSNCALQDTIVFPQTLKHISYNAFGMNGNLKAVKFPVGLEYIEGGAFNNCSGLSEVRFPASVLSVGSAAFEYCNSIKDVYTYIIDPLQLDQTTFSAEVFKNATLHVPETAQNNYYWDTQWSQFPSIVTFNEPYEYFYLNKDLVIDEETPRLEGDTIPGTGEVQGPDADLNPGSGLVVEGSESQDLGDVHLKDDGNGNGASVIGQGDKDGHCNINAKNLHIDIQVEANRWYFFCFPYPIDKKNINVSVFFTKLGHCRVISITDCFDQFVGKLFTGNVKYFAVFIMINNEMSNRMHQMSFSQTCTAIDKERIVGITRGFGNCKSCCLGKFIIASDYKGIKSVFWIQMSFLAACVLRLRFWRNFLFFRNIFRQYEIDVTVFHSGNFTDRYLKWKFVFFTYIIETYLL